MSQLLGVSGPTGAGKTTMARRLASYSNARLMQEPPPLDLLRKFGEKPHEFCFDLQAAIVLSRLKRFRENADAAMHICDRTVSEDREVFFNLHHKLGFLDSRQLRELRRLSFDAEAEMGTPNPIIYVTASLNVLRQRLEDRVGEQFTPRLLIDSLDLQLELYEVWRKSVRVPFALIDNSGLGGEELDSISKWAAATAVEVRNGSLPKCDLFQIEWSTNP